MLGLTLSSTLLHHVSCSFLFLPQSSCSSNRTVLKTSHAARKVEGICYTLDVQWILWMPCSWIGIFFPVELCFICKSLFFSLSKCIEFIYQIRNGAWKFFVTLLQTLLVLVSKHHRYIFPSACSFRGLFYWMDIRQTDTLSFIWQWMIPYGLLWQYIGLHDSYSLVTLNSVA